MELPEPSCIFGYTYDDIDEILGPRVKDFWKWMTGQTMMLCNGKSYDHDRHEYFTTLCSGMFPGVPVSDTESLAGHGGIVYPWDLERFLAGLPVVD